MHSDEIEVVEPDGHRSVVFRWSPEAAPRGALHILHGWAEHALRYDRFATRLAGAGYLVTADDHRGHGQTGVRNNTLGDLGDRGTDGVLDSVRAVTQRTIDDADGAPFFLLGHSWGSFLLQRYLRRWAAGLSGAILTGTTYRDPSAPPTERRPPNERFEPARTPYDWLTRDEAEVDAYISDPLCGFEMMRSTPMSGSARPPTSPSDGEIAEPGVPAHLPILVVNGADDPVGGEEGGAALAAHYRSLGVTDVTFKAYPGARHELLNETNRDEVEHDLIEWLAARTP